MKIEFRQNKHLPDNFILLEAKEESALINKIITDIQESKTVLKCSLNNRTVLQPINDFITFYSAEKKVFGKTNASEYLVSHRLYELENLLPPNFIRISNTEIINLNDIKKLEVSRNGIILIFFKNGSQTSSSRRYLKNIKERLL